MRNSNLNGDMIEQIGRFSLRRRDFIRISAFAAANAGLLSLGVPFSAAAANEKDAIAYLSATEQIRRFKAGTLSPVDVLKAQMDRIKRYNGPLNASGRELKDFMAFNGKVNAITYEHFDQAMKAAKESEKRYRNGTARALECLTVAIKD